MAEEFYYGNRFPIGSVAYFIKRDGWDIRVGWGIISENRSFEPYIDLLEPKKFGATINGVPVEEFETPSHWQKIPKNWSYDTKMFDWNQGGIADFKLDITDPQSILDAYEKGYLVRSDDVAHGRYEAEYDTKHGWRIVFKSDFPGKPTIVHLPLYKVFNNYADAKAIVDAELAELERQRNLTDAEWSLEEIERVIERWKANYEPSEEDVRRVYEFIEELPHIEDVETRVVSEGIQWKRWKNKRWANILQR